jgi:hypothetical protein
MNWARDVTYLGEESLAKIWSEVPHVLFRGQKPNFLDPRPPRLIRTLPVQISVSRYLELQQVES